MKPGHNLESVDLSRKERGVLGISGKSTPLNMSLLRRIQTSLRSVEAVFENELPDLEPESERLDRINLHIDVHTTAIEQCEMMLQTVELIQSVSAGEHAYREEQSE